MAILLQESKREIQDQSRLAPPSGFRNRTMPSEMVGTNTFTLVQTDEFECGITVFVYTIRLKCNVACINAVLKNGHIQAIQYPIHKIIHQQNINIIIEEPPFYVDSFQLPDAQKYRYLICDFQNTEALGYFYAIAEIKAYDKERKELTGHWSGNTGTKGHELPLLSDQDRVSYYQPDRFQENQSIVLDLGSPQPIAQVAFYPRNDDNKIVSGELYELFYWDGEWISCGKQYARDNKLVYNGIPENALFRIHNHTRGKEHRPFTYEGGKQIWW